MREKKMSDVAYKSDVANTAAAKYGIDLSKESITKELGSGYDHSNMATIEGIVSDLKDLRSAVQKASVKPGLLGVVYRATDKLGVTSPQARLNGTCRKMEVQIGRVDRQIRAQEGGIEVVEDKLKTYKNKKRSAERMYSGLKGMTLDMHGEMGKLKDAVAQNAAQAAQATDVSQSASAYEAKEQCKEQLEKLGDDIRELGYLKKRAATKIVMLEQNLNYAASEKNLRRMARDKLEDVKNGLELQICEAQAIVSLGHGPMIEVFDQLGKTYAVSDEAAKTIGTLSDTVFKKTLEIGREGLSFEPPNIDKLEERNREMARVQDNVSSRVERLAEQIINKDAA
jgi:hypothetical protein